MKSDIPEGFVDLGLPSGLLWAEANIDVTTRSGFQEVNGEISPYKYECSFFSWGNTDGHNPISNWAFDYNWGTSNSDTYASTPGAQLTGDMPLSHDAARVNLGAPWRMPTTAEYVELFANIDYLNGRGNVIDAASKDKRCTYNEVTGLRLRSKINGEEIFFACTGNGYNRSLTSREKGASYWSASLYSNTSNGWCMSFSVGGAFPQNYNYRYLGLPVRPVIG